MSLPAEYNGGATNPELIPRQHQEFDGVAMGVLPDGTPYLTARGLARFVGVVESVIITLSTNWKDEKLKPRGQYIHSVLQERGYLDDSLFVRIRVNGTVEHAHPDTVCVAVLEYYAFELGRPEAKNRIRMLTQKPLREFIYSQVGYDPQLTQKRSQAYILDLLRLNQVQDGFFSVLYETAHLAVRAAEVGLPIDSHTVPDISIGICWANHWRAERMAARFGDRKKHPHRYPRGYPQANAEVECNIYPLAALGEFRIWLETVYLPTKLKPYLKEKVRTDTLTWEQVDAILGAVTRTLPLKRAG